MKIEKIFGAAGVGKTSTCVSRIQDYLHNNYTINDIAFFTFTRAGRAAILEKLNDAGIIIPKNHYFRTFHSVCSRELGWGKADFLNADDLAGFAHIARLPFYHNYGEFDSDDPDEINLNLILDFYDRVQNVTSKPFSSHEPRKLVEMFGKFYSLSKLTTFMIQSLVNSALRFAAWKADRAKQNTQERQTDAAAIAAAVTEEDIEDVMTAAREKKSQRTSAYVYSDCLLSYLESHGDIRARIIIVDECQDLSPLQANIVKLWCEEHAASRDVLLLVGDDAQSIYTYAGADPAFLVEYGNDLPEISRPKFDIITTSYRLPPKIVAFNNHILGKIKYGIKKQMTAVNTAFPGEIIKFSGNMRQLLPLIQPHETNYFLFRTNSLKYKFAKMLWSQTHIPFGVIGIKQACPKYTRNFVVLANAINRLASGQPLTPEEVEALFVNSKLHTRQKLASKDLRGILHQLTPGSEALDELTWKSSTLIAAEDVWKKVFIRPLHIFAAAYAETKEHILQMLDFGYSAQKKTITKSAMLMIHERRAKLAKIDRHMNIAPRPDADLHTETMLASWHSVKGLEADNVFVYLGAPTLVESKTGGVGVLDDPELRAFFVACSRARKRLILIMPEADIFGPAHDTVHMTVAYARVGLEAMRENNPPSDPATP